MSIGAGNSSTGSITGSGAINLTGNLNWNAGTIAGTGTLNVRPGAFLGLGSSLSNRTLGRVLNNFSVMDLTSASLTLNNGTLINQAGGELNVTGGGSMLFSGGGANRITNFGTINANGTGSLALGGIGIPFTNAGTILANSGSVGFSTGTVTENAGAWLGGASTFEVGGTTGVAHLINGTTVFAGSKMFLGNLNFGTLTGPGDIMLSGDLTWVNGRIEGTGAITIAPGGRLTLGPGFTSRTLSRLLNNSSVITFSDGSLTIQNGTFNNLANGVVNLSTPTPFGTLSAGQGAVTNAGTINVISGASIGTILLGSSFLDWSNSGTINVVSGTASFASGTSNWNTGAVLRGPGVIDFGLSPRFIINGTTTFAGSNMIMSSQGGGTITGSGNLILTGNLAWNGGTITGSGSMNIVPSGLVSVGSSSITRALSRVINNSGTFNFEAGSIVMNNGTLNNDPGGNLNLFSNPNFVAGGGTNLLNNQGTLLVPTGLVSITVPFINTGTVIVGSVPSQPAPAPPLTKTTAVTLSLGANARQLSGSTLTGGTWIVGADGMLDFPGGGVGSITVNQGTVILSSPGAAFPAFDSLTTNQGALMLFNGHTFTSTGSLNNSGVINVDRGGALVVNGALTNSGTVHIEQLRAGPVDISAGGILQILPGGTRASVATGLSIAPASPPAPPAPAGLLDLTDSSFVIDYSNSSPIDAVRQMLADGRIISSVAGPSKTIGFADNAVLGVATFGGVSVDATSILFQLCFDGDSNLDGKVDVTDLGALATNWQTSSVWTGGDFNYDGFVDVSDLGILATNWQAGAGSPLGRTLEQALASVGLGNTSVPEPARWLLTVLFAALALRRLSRC